VLVLGCVDDRGRDAEQGCALLLGEGAEEDDVAGGVGVGAVGETGLGTELLCGGGEEK
jgi:hypothetical protein